MTDTILEEARVIGFTQSSPDLTGNLLRTLAASKPSGRLLELGTGVGAGTYWLLHGMDATSSLVTVEQNPDQVAVAERHLGSDPRVTFWVGDGLEFLQHPHDPFDLVFADTWPGKIDAPELALDLVAPGGFYIVDDMELGWTEAQDLAAPLEDDLRGIWQGQRNLMDLLAARDDFHCSRLEWSTGLMVCVRKGV